MSADQVKLGYLYAEIVSRRDVSRFDELVVPGYVNHNAFAEPGLEGVKKVFGAMLAGVPRSQGIRGGRLRLGGRNARSRPLPL